MNRKPSDHNMTLFWKCLVGSAAAHMAAIAILLEQPVWISSLVQSLLGKIPSNSMDLTLGQDNLSPVPDTTWDVIITKRPASKPFDLPVEALEVLQPQGEYVASPFSWSDPLSHRPVNEWLTTSSTPLEHAETDTNIALLPILFLEIPDNEKMHAPASLLAVPLLPDPFEIEIPIAAVALQNEPISPSTDVPVSFVSEEIPNEIATIVHQPQLKETAFPFVYSPPDLESLHLPSLILSLSPENKPFTYSSLLPETASIPDKTTEKEALFLSLPTQESFAAIEAPAMTFEVAPTQVQMLTAIPKPRLASSVIPIDETLSYVPNFTFGEKLTTTIRNYKLPDLPSLAEWHDLFAIDVHIVPRKNEEDFLFSIVLTPKKEAMAYALKQNFHFVIDCSQKSARHRMPIYKRAVQRALGYLGSKQNFNIYLFDPQGVAYQKELVSATPKEIARAKDFLDKEKYKSQSRRTDLLAIMEYIANLPKQFDEIHTVILIADGDVIPERKKDEFNYWLRRLRGKVALYAASVGDGRAFDLELFAAASGGKTLNSPTNAAFARKLCKLVMDLQHPIAKELSVEIRSNNPDQPLSLASSEAILPPLYASQSYTIVGSAPTQEDFTFVLEGVTKDRFVEISKLLSLKTASKPTTPITPLLLEKMAQGELVQYMQDGERKYKTQAAKLLAGADGR